MTWYHKNEYWFIYIHAREKILNVPWHDCPVPEVEFNSKNIVLRTYPHFSGESDFTKQDFLLQTEGA